MVHTENDAQEPQYTLHELQYKLLEKANLSVEDAYTLSLVATGQIPYDEYQELIADRRNHINNMGRFAVQVAISGTITAFSMRMLMNGGDAGVYMPVLTGILGYWLPSPEMNKSPRLPAKNMYLRPPQTPARISKPPPPQSMLRSPACVRFMR